MREYTGQIRLLVEFSEYLSCSNTQFFVNKLTADVYSREIKANLKLCYGDALERQEKW